MNQYITSVLLRYYIFCPYGSSVLDPVGYTDIGSQILLKLYDTALKEKNGPN